LRGRRCGEDGTRELDPHEAFADDDAPYRLPRTEVLASNHIPGATVLFRLADQGEAHRRGFEVKENRVAFGNHGYGLAFLAGERFPRSDVARHALAEEVFRVVHRRFPVQGVQLDLSQFDVAGSKRFMAVNRSRRHSDRSVCTQLQCQRQILIDDALHGDAHRQGEHLRQPRGEAFERGFHLPFALGNRHLRRRGQELDDDPLRPKGGDDDAFYPSAKGFEEGGGFDLLPFRAHPRRRRALEGDLLL